MEALGEPLLDAKPKGDEKTAVAKRKLLIGAGLCTAFMLTEIVGGVVCGSLAIITDAAHMLSDVAGFLVGVIALVLTSRDANAKYSFGFGRAEVLGALASISIVWAMTLMLVYEACWRLVFPEVVDGRTMFVISLLGVGMNFVLMGVLGHDHGGHGHSHGGGGHDEAASSSDACCEHEHGHEHGHGHGAPKEHGHAHGAPAPKEHGHGHGSAPVPKEDCGHDHGHGGHEGQAKHDHGHGGAPAPEGGGKSEDEMLVMRAAIAHVIGDILQSIGVCIAGALIWAFSDRWLDANGISYWYRIDPVCTFLFSVLVMWSSIGTTRDAVHVLMAGTPANIDLPEVERELRGIATVVDVHCFHSWTIAGDKHNMMAHIMIAPGAETTPVLYAAQRIAARAGCHHTCFQVEDSGTYDKSVEGEDCYSPHP